MPGLLTTLPNVSLDELYNVLCGAASQDAALLKASTDRLKEMHGMFGTMDALNAIATEKSAPLQVRQQSIIQLKNLLPHSWKSRRYAAACRFSLAHLAHIQTSFRRAEG